MNLIDGKKIAAELLAEMQVEVSNWVAAGGKRPQLVAVLVGDDGASQTYVNAKVKACDKVGIQSEVVKLSNDIAQADLINIIIQLNQDPMVDGFIVQMPLPKAISENAILDAIDPRKDVDGFHPQNVGRMALNMPTFYAATPFGILQLLQRSHIPTEGKHCVIVGRSNIVGSPLSILLSKNTNPGNCTVTLTHSKTENLKEITLSADILVAAIGKPNYITADMVKTGAVIIDVGITRVPDALAKSGYQIKGDVDFNAVAPKASYITPVPGGVGPMTIIALLQNTIRAAKKEVYA